MDQKIVIKVVAEIAMNFDEKKITALAATKVLIYGIRITAQDIVITIIVADRVRKAIAAALVIAAAQVYLIIILKNITTLKSPPSNNNQDSRFHNSITQKTRTLIANL